MSGTTIGCLAIGSSGGGAAAVRGWPGRAGAGKRYTLFAGTSAPGGLVQITLTRETHGSLTLTSPNGGESWAIGSHETIAWTATGFGGAVDIELFKRNQKIGTIAREVPTAPGTYSWQVGQLLHKKTAGPGQAYRIRITNAHGPERDESDGGFNITR